MLKKLIPAYDWIKNYDRKDLSGDISAGFIVAIMLIPQGMAYAMLAGLPPVIGLYASTIPLLIYALFGSSRHLALGPVAMVSLLVYSGVSPLATPNTNEYISLVLLLMLMVGMIQFLLGVFRLGFLVNFMSQAVISAFTSAAAIIIAFSQLGNLLGLSIENKQVFLVVLEIAKKIKETNILALSIGLGSILLLLLLKRHAKKFPGPLLVVVLSTFVVYGFQLQDLGLSIVGEVPRGLAKGSIPLISLERILDLLPAALTISFIAFMESIAMAKAIARRENYKIEPNKELIGLGLANVGGAFFSGYPVTGGFSRSAVNYQAGARTPLATMITALLIMLSLLFFTSFFYYLPQAVLAAIIILAVYSLIDFKEASYLFSLNKIDGWTWIITFTATLFIGIEGGILIGITFSLLSLIGRSAYPNLVELGFVKDKNSFRNIKKYDEAIREEEMIVLRLDGSLYFANIGRLEEQVCRKVCEKQAAKWVILDFSGVNYTDSFALRGLKELMKTCQEKRGVKFSFTRLKGPVMDQFKRANLISLYGKDKHYPTNLAAVESIKNKT